MPTLTSPNSGSISGGGRINFYSGIPGPPGPEGPPGEDGLSTLDTNITGIGVIDEGSDPTITPTKVLIVQEDTLAQYDWPTDSSDPDALRSKVNNIYYAPGLSVSSTLADMQAAYPSGSIFTPLLVKSVRLGQTPDWGLRFEVHDNPFGSIPDIVSIMGFNPQNTAGFIHVLDVCEHYYAPGDYKSIEKYQSIAYPQSDIWRDESQARRSWGLSTFDKLGVGGFGVPMAMTSNADTFLLYSGNRRTVAMGGLGGPEGSYFSVSQDVPTARASMAMYSQSTGTENSLLVQLHNAGYALFETSRANGDIYFRPSAGGRLFLGGAGSNVVFQSDGISFFNGSSVARQTAGAVATDLASVITLANSLRTGLINFNLFN